MRSAALAAVTSAVVIAQSSSSVLASPVNSEVPQVFAAGQEPGSNALARDPDHLDLRPVAPGSNGSARDSERLGRLPVAPTQPKSELACYLIGKVKPANPGALAVPETKPLLPRPVPIPREKLPAPWSR